MTKTEELTEIFRNSNSVANMLRGIEVLADSEDEGVRAFLRHLLYCEQRLLMRHPSDLLQHPESHDVDSRYSERYPDMPFRLRFFMKRTFLALKNLIMIRKLELLKPLLKKLEQKLDIIQSEIYISENLL